MKYILIYYNLFFYTIIADASIVLINDKTELKLGAGTNIETEQVFPQCIEAIKQQDLAPEDSTAIENDKIGSARRLSVDSEVVRTYEQMSNYQNESFAAEANYLAYSGSFNYEHEQKMQMSSDQIIVGIKAFADYGRWYITNPKIKKPYLELAKKDIDNFYKVCGHEYVSGFTLGQGIKIILKSMEYSKDSYERLNIKAKASAKAASGSASVEGAFLSVATDLLKLGTLEVKIVAYGTNGISSISEILKTEKDVKSIVNVISELMREIKPEQSVKTSYLTSKYPILDQPYNQFDSEFKRESIKNLYYTFLKVNSDYQRLKSVAYIDIQNKNSNLCALKSEMSCVEFSAYLKKNLELYEKAVFAVLRTLQKCATDKNIEECRTSNMQEVFDLVLLPLQWPNQYLQKLRLLQYREKIREIIESGQGNR